MERTTRPATEALDRIALLTLAYRGVYDYDTEAMQRFVTAVAPTISEDDVALARLGELTDLFAIYADPFRADRYGGRVSLRAEVIAALQGLIARLPS